LYTVVVSIKCPFELPKTCSRCCNATKACANPESGEEVPVPFLSTVCQTIPCHRARPFPCLHPQRACRNEGGWTCGRPDLLTCEPTTLTQAYGLTAMNSREVDIISTDRRFATARSTAEDASIYNENCHVIWIQRLRYSRSSFTSSPDPPARRRCHFGRACRT
jgi:hypothetical protein